MSRYCPLYMLKKIASFRSLTASVTGKSVNMDHVSLIPGLVYAWRPSGTVGLFRFSFVWTVGYIRLAGLFT